MNFLKNMSYNTPFILPLGGYRQLVANMTAIILPAEKEIIVIDCGKGFDQPENNGRKHSAFTLSKLKPKFPNFKLLGQYFNKGYQIVALFITHGHGDHIAGYSEFNTYLKSFNITNYPVYCGEITAQFGSALQVGWPKKNTGQLNIVTNKSLHKVGSNSSVYAFRVNHSIIDTYAYYFKCAGKKICFVPDHLYDWTPVEGCGVPQQDVNQILRKINAEIPDITIMESTTANEFKTPQCESEAYIKLYNNICYYGHAKEGLFVTTFGTNLSRIKAVFNAAHRCKRKVAVFGTNMNKLIRVYFEKNLLDSSFKAIYSTVKDLKIISSQKKNWIVLTSGHQGEFSAGLTKILNGKIYYRWGTNDIVLFASRTIPRFACKIGRTQSILNLNSRRVTVVQDLHTSGHSSKNDLMEMARLINKSKKVLINHGDIENMVHWYEIGASANIDEKNIVLGTHGVPVIF